MRVLGSSSSVRSVVGHELFDVVFSRRTGKGVIRQRFWNCLSHVEELMLKDLVQRRSFLWIKSEDLGDKVLGLGGDLGVLGEGVVVLFDLLVGCLHVVGLEGRFTDHQGVDDHAQGPDVYFEGVPVATFKDFWGNIVRRSTNSPLSIPVKLQFGRKPKIAYLDLHLIVQEQVT